MRILFEDLKETEENLAHAENVEESRQLAVGGGRACVVLVGACCNGRDSQCLQQEELSAMVMGMGDEM